MSKQDAHRAVHELMAGHKGEGLKDIGDHTEPPREEMPAGARPVCLNHRWVPQPDGTHVVCINCGLTLVR